MNIRTNVIGSLCLIVIIMGTVYKIKHQKTLENEATNNEFEDLDLINESSENANSGPAKRQLRLPASDSVTKITYKTLPSISKIDKNKFSRVTKEEIAQSNNSQGESPDEAQSRISSYSSGSPSNYVSTQSLETQIVPDLNDIDDAGDIPMLLKKANSANDALQVKQGFVGIGQTTNVNSSSNDKLKISYTLGQPKSTTTNTTSSTSTASNPIPDPLKCSTNIDSGNFGNPLGVTITCNYPNTDVKFCLAIDNCCDPDSQGMDYLTKVVVGPKNGNYCLTYKGSSETGGISETFQANYTINSQLPDIQTGFEKLFYQTTELIGENMITSLDFGKSDHSITQINFKSRDPGPLGSNYNCDEMVANAPTLNTPTVMDILSLFGVDSLSPSSQVNIPLAIDKMSYGENFIASFIVNNTHAAPLYACSVTRIILDDFEFFQADIAQSEPGTNDIRQFEGQFTEYGFFESQITDEPTRAPAGENTEVVSGQKLKNGLLGMFY